MGKKKLSLKPVNRGFATTSIASKKKQEEPVVEDVPAEVSDENGITPTGTASASTPDSKSDRGAVPAPKEDWEDEALAQQQALQALVDRLHDKGEKEVTRIIKGIEYDKRLAAGFPRLAINESIRDQVLELALAEEQSTLSPTSPSINADGATKSIASPSGAGDADKTLLRLYVAFHVLRRLGFSEGRISQCLLEGLEEVGGWEEAIDWMWLHLSEDECLQKGDYAKKDDILISEQEDELLPIPDPDHLPSEPPSGPSTNSPTPARSASPPPDSGPISLFQSMDNPDPDDIQSDADSEPDLQRANTEWANLSLQMDNLRMAAGGRPASGKSKGKKGKANGAVLETPEMRRLKEKIGVTEKEYMFSRKEADVLLRSLKARRDAEALQARLNGKAVAAPSSITAMAEESAVVPRISREDEEDGDGTEEADDDEDGLFGNMLDEPSQPGPPGDLANTSASVITMRSMPIPKQVAYSGTTPKALLRTCLTKAYKSASVQYVPLSGLSRAARVGLQIGLPPNRRRVWRMDDIACEDMVEAENYMATLALHAFVSEGEVQGVYVKLFPPAYRDLWDELEVERRKKEDEGKREMWKMIKEIYERKAAVISAKPEEVDKLVTALPEIRNGISTRQPGNLEHLQRDYDRRRVSKLYQAMLPQRNSLPIASFRQTILDTLSQSQVMVLSGETGCGKSTQLPAYILEDQLAQGKPCKIYVTEPRRISAISLAQRVSVELGDAPGQMGTNSSLVGYSIRLEAKTSPSTRLAFVTNGIALRMLEAGSGSGKGTAFDEVTHIIVDEVHERSIDSDFLLIVLRQLTAVRPELKVVLMSATLDAEKISAYFGGCPVLAVPGRTFPVRVNYLEDAVEVAGWRVDEGSSYAIRPRNMRTSAKQVEWEENADESEDDDSTQDPSRLSATKYSVQTVSTGNLLDSRQIPYELIVRLLERICFEDPALQPFSAAVLVFMPGLAEIRKLNDMLSGHQEFGRGDFKIYPLHSTISSEGQSAVFDIPPEGVRKIVISTNIAETGVTIPDITCVIDSGKHREMRYDEKRQISRLVETYIARSNAKQRRGRAGRVREGLAFHLFTKNRHDTQLAEHPIPEMLRLSLQDLALRIKILRLKLGSTIEEVLLKALDPPTPLNIQRAIASLVEVKALTATEEITPMGKLLSKLPMDVHLGKFLLVAAMMRCLDPALTIAATLNSKSPWVTPFGMENQARTVKQGFAVDNNDFFTIVNIFNSWRRASDNPSFVHIFCRKNFVSQQNLQQIEELRQQLLSYLVDSGFVSATPEEKRDISQARYSRGFRTRFVSVPKQFDDNAEDLHILSAALASGLYPKILSMDASGGLKTITNQQPVSILTYQHPSSVNFKVRPADFGTSHLMYFTIMQSKRLYAWEVGAVDDRALSLLCGDQADIRASAGSLQLDRKIRYCTHPKTALAIKMLREKFSMVMATRMRGKILSSEQEKWFELGMRCLSVGVYQGEELSVGVNLAA